MSVLKVAVLVCGVGSVWSLINVRGNAPWFQQLLNNQGNNNLLGNAGNGGFMMGLLKGKNTRCNGTGADSLAEGVCQSKKECRKGGGTASGNCNLVGSCCIFENSCSNDTNAKISYFTSPRMFQNFCPLRIRLFNRNVCQIRLDFERFSIAGPPSNAETFDCLTDQFTVNGAGNLGFEAICGENTGQHIYIPVNASQGAGEIVLNFDFETNRTGLTVPTPDWRIKVTQLECGLGNDDINSIQSPLTILYQNHKNKKRGNAQRDNDLIAPPGCLQYYTESQGTYSSFNFNGGGPMIANTNYAVCFKRSSNTCGISHFGQSFDVSGNFNESSNTDPTGLGEDCTVVDPANPDSSTDWVLIPGGTLLVNGVTTTADYYCLDSLSQQTVTSRAPGPPYIVVNTDGAKSIFPESGFRINYNLLNQC